MDSNSKWQHCRARRAAGSSGFPGRGGLSAGVPEANMLDRQLEQDYQRNQLWILSRRKEGHEITLTVVVLQLFAQCRWGDCDDQSYSPVWVGSDKLEDNPRGQLNSSSSSSNSPWDCHGDGNTNTCGSTQNN